MEAIFIVYVYVCVCVCVNVFIFTVISIDFCLCVPVLCFETLLVLCCGCVVDVCYMQMRRRSTSPQTAGSRSLAPPLLLPFSTPPPSPICHFPVNHTRRRKERDSFLYTYCGPTAILSHLNSQQLWDSLSPFLPFLYVVCCTDILQPFILWLSRTPWYKVTAVFLQDGFFQLFFQWKIDINRRTSYTDILYGAILRRNSGYRPPRFWYIDWKSPENGWEREKKILPKTVSGVSIFDAMT